MKRKKNSKTLEDVSVAKLLDEFVDLDAADDPKKVTGMTDEQYVQLMLEKEAKRKMARERREPQKAKNEIRGENESDGSVPSKNCQNCFYCVGVHKVAESFLCACNNGKRELEARYFEYKWWVICQDHPPCWKSRPVSNMDAIRQPGIEPPAHRPHEIVTELSPETEEALTFLRDEVISVSSKRKALETIEKYRKEPPVESRREKKKTPVVSEKISAVKQCQNCYYCAAQRNLGGSAWCHCSNPARSIDATSTGKSWVKSTLNLPCWKATKE